MALTDTALKGMKPRGKPYIVSDDRGLYLEVFPSGGMAWRYRYRLEGQQEKLTLGKYPALSLKAARMGARRGGGRGRPRPIPGARETA